MTTNKWTDFEGLKQILTDPERKARYLAEIAEYRAQIPADEIGRRQAALAKMVRESEKLGLYD